MDLRRIKKYICLSYNISIDELNKNTKIYVKRMLNDLRRNIRETKLIREQIKIKLEDIDIYKRTMNIKSPNLAAIGEGKNNGGRKNTTELSQWQLLKLQEEVKEKVINLQLKLKGLESQIELVKEFIKMIDNPAYADVLIYTFIELKSQFEIANMLNYANDYIRQARFIGINQLCKILNGNKKNSSKN